MRANNIPISEWIVCTRKDIAANIDAIIQSAEKVAPYPLFVKPPIWALRWASPRSRIARTSTKV
jgi:hypothetical protein